MSYTVVVPILGARNIKRSYGDRDVLSDVSLTVTTGERLGLVGVNGSGKTTIARILAGMEEPDAGDIARGRGVTLGYLSQEPSMDPEASALDVALSGLTAWCAAVRRHEIAGTTIAAGVGSIDAAIAAQAQAGAEVERLGGWELRHQAEAMLGHLGIDGVDQPVGTMSGGERRRVALARVLVARPDVAVLDEPTNHLDIATIEWLERYLIERFTGALVLITHDRFLLDRVVTRTLEIDRGAVYSYDGGWGEYLAARAERQAHNERVESNRRNFLRSELEWLRRQPKARSTKQKARIGRANAAIDMDGPVRDRSARIAVGSVRTGKTVLDARELSVDIGGQRLVENLTIGLGKGERIGIVGPNGAGKTTLLRALLGELEPAAGVVTIGKNTRVAYLDQTREGLDDNDTVFDSIAEGRAEITLGKHTMDVHSYLERFLFDSSSQRQLVGTLSGGERARVALARVLRSGANLVVLDEPSNDLDVTTLSALEESLLEFGGTALVVTHDRWFLDRVATSILSFEGAGRVVQVHGNYSDYQRWRAHDRAARAAEPVASKPSGPSPSAATPAAKPASLEEKPLTYGEEIELDAIMERIDAAEAAVAELEAVLEQSSFGTKAYVEQAAFLEKLSEARASAESLVERWSELESRKAANDSQ